MTDLGTTPAVPINPNTLFSQKSLCVDGSSSLSPLDATLFFPQSGMGFAETEFTLSLWIKMSTPDPTGMVVDVLPNTSYFFHLQWLSGNQLQYRTKANGTTDDLTFTVGNPMDWHHIVIAFDGFASVANQRKTFYVDGQLVGQSTQPIEFYFGPGSTLQFSRPSYFMSAGCLDDIHVWHRQLNDSEVRQLYNQGYPATITGSLNDVAKSWTIEDTGSGSVVNDSQGTFNMSFIGSPKVEQVVQDPLQPGRSNPNAGNGSGSGSSPFEGGNDGYGGEFGNNGRPRNEGVFP